MKWKIFTVMCAAFAVTNALAEASQLAASDTSSKQIVGKNAGGEKQTTIIDENGNLKIIDSTAPATPAAAPVPADKTPPPSTAGNKKTDAKPDTTSPGMMQGKPNPGSSPNTAVVPGQTVKGYTPPALTPNKPLDLNAPPKPGINQPQPGSPVQTPPVNPSGQPAPAQSQPPAPSGLSQPLPNQQDMTPPGNTDYITPGAVPQTNTTNGPAQPAY